MLKLITLENIREIDKELNLTVIGADKGNAACALSLKVDGMDRTFALFVNPETCIFEEKIYSGFSIFTENYKGYYFLFRDPTIKTLGEAENKLKTVIESYGNNSDSFILYPHF